MICAWHFEPAFVMFMYDMLELERKILTHYQL